MRKAMDWVALVAAVVALAVVVSAWPGDRGHGGWLVWTGVSLALLSMIPRLAHRVRGEDAGRATQLPTPARLTVAAGIASGLTASAAGLLLIRIG